MAYDKESRKQEADREIQKAEEEIMKKKDETQSKTMPAKKWNTWVF